MFWAVQTIFSLRNARAMRESKRYNLGDVLWRNDREKFRAGTKLSCVALGTVAKVQVRCNLSAEAKQK